MSSLLYRPQPSRTRYTGQTAHALAMGGQLHPNRTAYDFYPKPPEATRALLSAHVFYDDIWEPACGQGHIAKVCEARCDSVTATDLIDYGYGEVHCDFRDETRPRAKNITTNPPCGRGLADVFCKHALDLAHQTGGRVATLIAVQSLCHPIRTAFFQKNPSSVIYALDDCNC